jgi:hypothetical protein
MNSVPSSAVQSAPSAISGKVFGGQQPVTGSTVTVWAAGTGVLNAAYATPSTLLATTTTDSNGNFAFPANAYVCPTPTTQVYLLAQGGNPGVGSGSNPAITLAAGVGNCSSAPSLTVNVNEVTTVATAYSLAQFFQPTTGNGPQDGFGGPSDTTALANANTYTIPTLVNLGTGTVNPNTPSFTIESAKLYTLADIIAACVNSASGSFACSALFTNTAAPGASFTPTDTLQAAVLMALFPYQNVSTLFGLIPPSAPFQGLATAPHDFTLGVSYIAPNLGLTVAANTSSNIDIDSTGRVWFPSNKPGAVGAAVFDPTTNTFAGPYGGSISQAPLTSPQYLAIDQNDNVWITDQASGNVVGFESSAPSNYLAFAVPGVTGGPITTNIDNKMVLSNPQSGVPYLSLIDPVAQVLYTQIGVLSQTPTALASSWNQPPAYLIDAATSSPNSHCLLEDSIFDEKGDYRNDIDADPGANCISGGVAVTSVNADFVSVASSINQLCSFDDGCFTPSIPLNLPQGIATDGGGSEWIANSGNASVSTLYGPGSSPSGNPSTDYTQSSPIQYLHDSANGATITTPFGIAIDEAGNVWLSNACTSACSSSPYILSELIGAANPAITPIAAQYGGNFSGQYPFITKGGPTASAHSLPGSHTLKPLNSHLTIHAITPTRNQ